MAQPNSGKKAGKRLFPVILAMMTLFMVQCPYLNTFYNAKTAYKAARREHRRFTKTNPDTSADLPGGVISNYDRTVEKSKKLLDVYPQSKKWHDDAIFLMGKAGYYKGDYTGAIHRMRRLQREFPESPYIPESFLFLGKAYLEDENLAKAEETFEYILANYPELNDNEEITLLKAQLAIRQEGKSRAIQLLSETLSSVTNPQRRLEIIAEIAGLYYDLRQYRSALDILKDAPNPADYPHLAYRTASLQMDCHLELGDFEKVITIADRVLREKANVKYFPEIRLRKGLALIQSGKTKDAVEEFEIITAGTGPEEVRGKAWYRLGLIHQHTNADFEKAQECYQEAYNLLSEGEMRADAQQRLDALKKLPALRDSVESLAMTDDTTIVSDSTDTLDRDSSLNAARYKLGEVFWLRLDEPDSALNWFAAINSDTTADPEETMKALYARAWIERYVKADTTRSDSLYEALIEKYPGTLYAKRSQKDMEVPVTIETMEDSAFQAFRSAERLYFVDDDPKGAYVAYQKVALNYPDSEYAPKSLYAAAWLCDNVLNYDVAGRKLYEKLCDKYPDSEACTEAAAPKLAATKKAIEELQNERLAERRKKKLEKKAEKTGGDAGEKEEVKSEDDATAQTDESAEETAEDSNDISEEAIDPEEERRREEQREMMERLEQDAREEEMKERIEEDASGLREEDEW